MVPFQTASGLGTVCLVRSVQTFLHPVADRRIGYTVTFTPQRPKIATDSFTCKAYEQCQGCNVTYEGSNQKRLKQAFPTTHISFKTCKSEHSGDLRGKPEPGFGCRLKRQIHVNVLLRWSVKILSILLWFKQKPSSFIWSYVLLNDRDVLHW